MIPLSPRRTCYPWLFFALSLVLWIAGGKAKRNASHPRFFTSDTEGRIVSDNKGWIGVDLDGTLALYDHWRGAGDIGEPVPSMVERVKNWLDEGVFAVRVFTARVSPANGDDAAVARTAIEAWCVRHIGRSLPVTHEKDFGMVVLYDDRCVQVEKNTGRIVGKSP